MLFSILMCTYNSSKTLKNAIDSVICQECDKWELVILDNGSVDETAEILREYQRKDERIRCIFREDNVGWCKGISICLEQASGQYMMFLGADDYLPHKEVLEEVKKEILDYMPDIVWTGASYATFDGSKFQIAQTEVPQYRRYSNEDKLSEVVEIMQSISYNSVMHYVRIDFLKEHGIDFYEPFYGDCQGMTEALCKAKRMVVMDKAEYVLTVNTSQTSSKVGFDYDISRQWKSIKETLEALKVDKNSPEVSYIAERILRNLAAMCENIVMGADLRNHLMNPVEKTVVERFLKAEEWISSEAFGEMIYYAGKREFTEQLIGAAGVLYWTCKPYDNIMEEIKNKSKWLAEFVELVLEVDEKGQIAWKTKFSKEEERNAMVVLKNLYNKYEIGSELLMKEVM